jgi:hypothetical protein
MLSQMPKTRAADPARPTPDWRENADSAAEYGPTCRRPLNDSLVRQRNSHPNIGFARLNE